MLLIPVVRTLYFLEDHMAFTVPSKDETIKVVARSDEAVKCDAETYNKYLECLDESLLQLDGEPVRFVLRKSLPFKYSQKVAAMQTKMVDGEMVMNIGYIAEEVRYALKEIENIELIAGED